MIIEGQVGAVYGDNISTDEIISAKYIKSYDPEEMGKVALFPVDPAFSKKMREAPILVAGKNFGCGSSRETAPVAIRAAGARIIIADFFSRLFFRTAINVGLPIMESEGISALLSVGDLVRVDLLRGTIENRTKGTVHEGSRWEAFLIDIIRRGGLIPDD